MLKNLITLIVIIVVAGAAYVLVPWEKLPLYGEISAGEVEMFIDTEIFGKEKIVRKQAEIAIAQAKADVDRMKTIIVNSTAEAELLDEKVAHLRAEETVARRELADLAQLIDTGEAITTQTGQVWTIADLQNRAHTRIAQHQSRLETIAIYTESAELHRQTAAQAQSAMLSGQNSIARMEASLAKLDAKLDQLAMYENMPAVTIAANGAVVQTVHDAEQVIEELFKEVGSEIRRQQLRQEIQLPSTPNLPIHPAVTDVELVNTLRELAGEAR